MPRRSKSPVYQTSLDVAAAPEPRQVEPPTLPASNTIAERSPEYTTAPKWVDTAGKTRTWVLCDPEGGHVAEITTKRDAQRLADLLNGGGSQRER